MHFSEDEVHVEEDDDEFIISDSESEGGFAKKITAKVNPSKNTKESKKTAGTKSKTVSGDVKKLPLPKKSGAQKKKLEKPKEKQKAVIVDSDSEFNDVLRPLARATSGIYFTL